MIKSPSINIFHLRNVLSPLTRMRDGAAQPTWGLTDKSFLCTRSTDSRPARLPSPPGPCHRHHCPIRGSLAQVTVPPPCWNARPRRWASTCSLLSLQHPARSWSSAGVRARGQGRGRGRVAVSASPSQATGRSFGRQGDRSHRGHTRVWQGSQQVVETVQRPRAGLWQAHGPAAKDQVPDQSGARGPGPTASGLGSGDQGPLIQAGSRKRSPRCLEPPSCKAAAIQASASWGHPGWRHSHAHSNVTCNTARLPTCLAVRKDVGCFLTNSTFRKSCIN